MSKKIIAEIQARIAEEGSCVIYRSTSGAIFIPDQNRAAEDGSSAQDAEFHFIASDETKDDHGTIFKLNGWNLESFRRNPLITAQHPYLGTDNTYMFIGRGVYAEIVEDKLRIGVDLQKKGNPVAEDVRNKLIEKIWNSSSIYARVYDGRYGISDQGEDPETFYFINQELLALGIVSKGSNRSAVLVDSPKPKTKEEEPTPPAEENEEDDTTAENERLAQLEDIASARAMIAIMDSKLSLSIIQ